MNLKLTYSLLFFFSFLTAFGQRTLSGRILDEYLESAIGISVFDKDTTELGKTDFNGYFKIELPKNSDKLIIAGVGYEWTKISVPENCENLELILLLASIYHYKSHSKVDRIRKKQFDKIPELHKQAYEKGLFKTKTPCVTRVFEPKKEKLDEISKNLNKLKKENKKDFELLNVGDTITIPFSESYKAKEGEPTELIVYSYIVTGNEFRCKIQGIITNKRKNRRGYFLTYRVTDKSQCEHKSITYNDKPVKVGQTFEHNMKYFKVITK